MLPLLSAARRGWSTRARGEGARDVRVSRERVRPPVNELMKTELRRIGREVATTALAARCGLSWRSSAPCWLVTGQPGCSLTVSAVEPNAGSGPARALRTRRRTTAWTGGISCPADTIPSGRRLATAKASVCSTCPQRHGPLIGSAHPLVIGPGCRGGRGDPPTVEAGGAARWLEAMESPYLYQGSFRGACPANRTGLRR